MDFSRYCGHSEALICTGLELLWTDTTQMYIHLTPAALEDAICLLDGDDSSVDREGILEPAGTKIQVLDLTWVQWWRRRESNPHPKIITPGGDTGSIRFQIGASGLDMLTP